MKKPNAWRFTKSVIVPSLLLGAHCNHWISQYDALKKPANFNADLMVVYTGGWRRLRAAFKLHIKRPKQKLFISGVNKDETLESLCKKAGVDIQLLNTKNIVLSDFATDTFYNAYDVVKFVKLPGNENIKSIVIIYGKPYAARGKKVTDIVLRDSGLANKYDISFAWMKYEATSLETCAEPLKLLATQWGKPSIKAPRSNGKLYAYVKPPTP